MFNNQSAPMQNNSTQVQQTKDYSKFRTLDGNRSVNPLHLKRLKDSISSKYLFTIITVNDKFEIIDGQHRFNVCKELNLPINYVVVNGYGLNEVQILNANAKTWNVTDYLNGYCNLGLPEYLKYRNFMLKHGFGHKINLILLTGNNNGDVYESFHRGSFVVDNIVEAESIANKIHAVKEFYEGADRLSFVTALIRINKNKEFNFNEFLDKLRFKSRSLVDCTTAMAYRALIEDIYNFKRREKVNLRY